MCGAVEVRSALVAGRSPDGASAAVWLARADVDCGEPFSLSLNARLATYPVVRFLFARYLYILRILKRLVRLRNMKPFAPVALLAYLITSNHLRGEQCQLPRC